GPGQRLCQRNKFTQFFIIKSPDNNLLAEFYIGRTFLSHYLIYNAPAVESGPTRFLRGTQRGLEHTQAILIPGYKSRLVTEVAIRPDIYHSHYPPILGADRLSESFAMAAKAFYSGPHRRPAIQLVAARLADSAFRLRFRMAPADVGRVLIMAFATACNTAALTGTIVVLRLYPLLLETRTQLPTGAGPATFLESDEYHAAIEIRL
ncbi:hypothetical protein, partial [Mycobacteroides abscessus]|uniref:hypothetical protein n=2 Tax=Mycobacteroides abscessus TaxID=36809 RepID=UPI0019D03464